MISSYTSNQAATTALAAGQLDWAGNGIPNIRSVYVAKDPAHNADWNEYSTLHLTGWPAEQNPYVDPSPNDPELPYILMHLKPVS